MKVRNPIISTLFLLILLLACGKGDDPLVIDERICTQLTDTSGFSLYHYPYFSKEDWYNLSHDDKVKNRQLPDDVLKKLTMEQLFNQCMWWEDLARDILLFNSNQTGFRTAFYERFNGIQELYKREGIHIFLEKKVKNFDVVNISSGECWFYNHLLEYIYVQQECLVHYPKSEIVRCLDVLFAKTDRYSYLTTIDPHKWGYYELSQWMIGISNVMIIHEYKPFLDEIEKDMELKSFLGGWIENTPNVIIKVSKFGTEFYNKMKNEIK